MLEINNLSKTYRQGSSDINVLSDLELLVEPGESVAILGQSGSGKSTLLSLVAGLDQPSSGSIVMNHQNIEQLSEKKLSEFRAKNLGIVFQQFHLMSNLTALENIRLPLEIFKDPKAQEKASRAIEQVGLKHRANHFPSELSGGEKQRIAIARAFVVEPKILLADEPSGNLDQDTGDKIMELIFEICRTNQTTFILVTHNISLAARCNRVLVLEHGRLNPYTGKTSDAY